MCYNFLAIFSSVILELLDLIQLNKTSVINVLHAYSSLSRLIFFKLYLIIRNGGLRYIFLVESYGTLYRHIAEHFNFLCDRIMFNEQICIKTKQYITDQNNILYMTLSLKYDL